MPTQQPRAGDPTCPQIKADLCSAGWKATTRSIQIEGKHSIRERLGRSPERGESVLFALDDSVPRQRQKQRGSSGGAEEAEI
jgi:hypothetical protein